MSSPPTKRAFNKPWLSCSDQIALLQTRGLTVRDPAAAAEFLLHINYYRFSGYCLAFKQDPHRFLPGVSFEQVRGSYDFDRVLRDLVTEALELIELDFRATIAHHFGRVHGPFGHTSAAVFFTKFRHAEWLSKLHEESERSRESFVTHFKATYVEFPDLPVWIATEVMSFGTLSRMYAGMLRADQRAIAARYGFQPSNLLSIMHHFVYVRNLCAHHSRLWDRIWAIKSDLPPGKAWSRPLLPSNNRLFATLLLLCQILHKCPAAAAFDEEWRVRVHAHLLNPPQAPQCLERMGLTSDWETHPIWNRI